MSEDHFFHVLSEFCVSASLTDVGAHGDSEEAGIAEGSISMMGEAYKLTCYACTETVEVAAANPESAAFLTCPRCGAGFEIDWRSHGGEPALRQLEARPA
jgi:hypothetical protein